VVKDWKNHGDGKLLGQPACQKLHLLVIRIKGGSEVSVGNARQPLFAEVKTTDYRRKGQKGLDSSEKKEANQSQWSNDCARASEEKSGK